MSVQGKGVDVILDCVGAPYLEKGLECLAVDGCLVYIGFMGGKAIFLDTLSLLTSHQSQEHLRAGAAHNCAAVLDWTAR